MLSFWINIGTTTGISSHDRALTTKALANPNLKPTELNRPGHILPLRAQPGGVLTRVGHTEASVDLARLAGKAPAAAICEMVLDEGGMARRDDLLAFGRKFGLKVVTIEDLVKYRIKHGV
jgi:3,4-dihydroxy-2-butanone 4-phosphate synthase